MTFCAGCCIRTPSGGNILLSRAAHFRTIPARSISPSGGTKPRRRSAPSHRTGSRRARSTRFWSAFPRERCCASARSRGARTRSAYTCGHRPPALWRRSLRLAGRYALPPGPPLGVSFAPPPRHRGNAGARRSAAGRSRKKDGGAPPPLNTPPPPAGSTGSGGGVIIENSYPEYTRCRCGGSRAFRIPRGSRAFRCVSLW